MIKRLGLSDGCFHISLIAYLVAVWLSGNIIGRINQVTLRRAGLVLRWVTVHCYTVLALAATTNQRRLSLTVTYGNSKLRYVLALISARGDFPSITDCC